MYTYSITFKKQSFPRLISFLDEKITRFLTNFVTKESEFKYNYEKDKNGILHMHGMFKTPNYLDIKNLIKVVWPEGRTGWSINCEQTRDVQRWNQYIVKDWPLQTNLLNEAYQEENDYRESLEERKGIACDQPCPFSQHYAEEDDLIRRWKSQPIVKNKKGIEN